MTPQEALVGLNLFLDIGSTRLTKLLESFGTPENILCAPQHRLTQVPGIGEEIAQKIRALKIKDIEKEFVLSKKLGIKIKTISDLDYPVNLKNIFDPPIVLYVKGELRAQDNLGIGIVGARHATLYGLVMAEKFAEGLSASGFTVVSGMARGIDSAAHRGALKHGGRTIAVIGSGLANIYPPENQKLAEQISQSGAVISEFPIRTQPLRMNFPRRNRLISGLSLGILVVEAARNSGALITADFALQQGRDVFALPGKIDSANSFGPNELIKQGAKLVTSAHDILEEFDFIYQGPRENGLKQKEVTQVRLRLDAEMRLYDLIPDEAIQLEELVEKASLEIPQVFAILLQLQMKGLIRQLPGKRFERRINEN